MAEGRNWSQEINLRGICNTLEGFCPMWGQPVGFLAWLPEDAFSFGSLSRRERGGFHFYKYLQGEVPEGPSSGKSCKSKKLGVASS